MVTEIFLVICVSDTGEGYQYAQELEGGRLEQLAVLNGLLDVAKGNIVKAINEISKFV